MNQASNQMATDELFEEDSYPGKPKILFIGLSNSSHTRSWIDLLTGTEFNIRLFSSNYGIPPLGWEIATYITSTSPLEDAGKYRKNLHPTSLEIQNYNEESQKYNEELQKYKRKKNSFYLLSVAKRGLNLYARLFNLPEVDYNYTRFIHRSLHNRRLSEKCQFMRTPLPPVPLQAKAESPQAWLAQLIRDWKPDIIHALGCFDSQGGEFLYETIKSFGLNYKGKVVVQLRGGSDLTLRRHDPEIAKQILDIFSKCDQIITDNYFNIEYIKKLGFADKIASIAPVPGTGGLDTDVEIEDIVLPSKKERIILWPKAYESLWSKALPVMEALTSAWNEIKPCRIYMTASTPETETWFWTLPVEIRKSCTLVQRIPQNELMELMKKARVLLAPSLVDGTPNSLYEAMINGAFPIVSPLDTIKPIVKNKVNVLFARNLYPKEISQALVRAMSDDALVDNAAKNNLRLVKKIASRRIISKRVVEYYNYLVGGYRKEDNPLVTIITPTYDRADYLPETIESVLNQNYPNIEYIVLDDGSKDNTLEVLKKYEGKIIIEAHANMGETETVNKGFRMAKGEFICVVNSDDPLLPGAITKMVSALMAEPDALAVYPDWVEIDPLSRPVKERKLPDYNILNMIDDFNVAMGPGSIFKRSVLEIYGFRDAKRRYTGDLEFWFRLASHGKLVHIPEILATHRTHPHSASVSDKSSKMAEELLSITESLLASSVLPKELQDNRYQTLSRAYFASIFYCKNQPARKLKYFLFAFLYDPKFVTVNIYWETVDILHRINVSVVRCATTFLRVILPEKTFNALRVWRQGLGKTKP